MNRLRSIDLFAGIGGIRLGFDRAFGDDIETVFVSEWDAHAQGQVAVGVPVILLELEVVGHAGVHVVELQCHDGRETLLVDREALLQHLHIGIQLQQRAVVLQ